MASRGGLTLACLAAVLIELSADRFSKDAGDISNLGMLRCPLGVPHAVVSAGRVAAGWSGTSAPLGTVVKLRPARAAPARKIVRLEQAGR